MVEIRDTLSALRENKLFEAAALLYRDTDKLSMLVAIATGRVASSVELGDLFVFFGELELKRNTPVEQLFDI